MSANSPIHPFRVYILRYWGEQTEPTSLLAWRFSLEPINASERRGFTDLDSLAIFIRGEMQVAEADMKQSATEEASGDERITKGVNNR